MKRGRPKISWIIHTVAFYLFKLSAPNFFQSSAQEEYLPLNQGLKGDNGQVIFDTIEEGMDLKPGEKVI